ARPGARRSPLSCRALLESRATGSGSPGDCGEIRPDPLRVPAMGVAEAVLHGAEVRLRRGGHRCGRQGVGREGEQRDVVERADAYHRLVAAGSEAAAAVSFEADQVEVDV